ncbi:MFS transporter [Mailhella sp.]|uniref:MFS transporter n=1 Tax=Mailhella sp. TaxID=1981029 RepID=UPI003AB23D8F
MASVEQPLSLRLKAVIAALWTGNLFAPFLMSGVAAILPSIGESLGAPAVMLSLVMVCYNLGQSISHMLSGRIADMFGVKRTLLAGVGCFCLFSVFMGLAPAMEVIIPLRFAQGVAAATISCAVTTLSVVLAPPHIRGQVISIVVSAVYLGLAIGPLACGGLTELTGWRSVFFLIAALGLVELALLHHVIPEQKREGERRSLDGISALLGAWGLFCVTMGATCTFLHPAVTAMLPVGVLILACFVRREWTSSDPILDLKLLAKVPGLPDGMAAVFINYGSFMGLSLFFSLYLQQVLGLNAFHAGMILMTQSLFQTFFSPVAGRLADRYHPCIVSTSGMALCGLSILSLMLLDEGSPVWQVALSQAALGTGAGFFAAPNMAATLGNVPKEHLSVASGLLGCLRTMGGLVSHIVMACMIGLFMGDSTVTPETSGTFLHAMRYTLLLFGVFNLMGVWLSLRALRHHR